MLKALQTKQLATPIHLLCTSILILLKKTPSLASSVSVFVLRRPFVCVFVLDVV